MRQLVVLDLVTDLSIGLACAAIAFALIHFARRPTELPYARVFVAFAVFIIADGATHLAAVWSVWQPSAWLATLLKVATALASVAVALVLPPLVPKALGSIEDAPRSRAPTPRRSAAAPRSWRRPAACWPPRSITRPRCAASRGSPFPTSPITCSSTSSRPRAGCGGWRRPTAIRSWRSAWRAPRGRRPSQAARARWRP